MFYNLRYLLSNLYFRNHKEVYICYKCGLMVVPSKSYVKEYSSLTHDYGWKKLKNPKRWICHHCDCHVNDCLYDSSAWTQDEWKEYVQDFNEAIIDVIELNSLCTKKGVK